MRKIYIGLSLLLLIISIRTGKAQDWNLVHGESNRWSILSPAKYEYILDSLELKGRKVAFETSISSIAMPENELFVMISEWRNPDENMVYGDSLTYMLLDSSMLMLDAMHPAEIVYSERSYWNTLPSIRFTMMDADANRKIAAMITRHAGIYYILRIYVPYGVDANTIMDRVFSSFRLLDLH